MLCSGHIWLMHLALPLGDEFLLCEECFVYLTALLLLSAPGGTPLQAPPQRASSPAAPPGSSHSASRPRSVCTLGQPNMCRVVVCGIGDSTVLGVFLVWFCVGIRVGLVICLCVFVLGVFLCSVGVLVRCCLFMVVFCSVFCYEELFACSLWFSACVFVQC